MTEGFIRSALRRLGRESAVYGLGMSLAQVAAFLLLPILTRQLNQSDFGVVSIATTTGAIVSTLISAGIGSALLRSYYDHDDESGRRRVVFTSLAIIAGGGAVVLLGAGFGGRAFSEVLFGSSRFAFLILALVGDSVLRALQSVAQSVLRAEHRARAFIATNIALFVTRFALTTVLLGFFGLGLRGYAIGLVLSALVGFMLALWLIRNHIAWCWSNNEARRLIAFGLPVMVSNLASAILVGADRYFLRASHGLEVVGVYNVGYQLASIVTVLLVTPIATAWPAIMLPLKDRPGIERFLAVTLTLVSAVGAWIVVALAFAGPLLLRVIAPTGYGSAAFVIPLVALANCMVLVQRILAAGNEVKRKMVRYAVPFIVSAVIVVVLDVLLIPRWGMYGAAAATLAAYCVLPALAFLASQSVMPVKYQTGKLVVIGATCVSLVAAGLWAGGASASSWLYQSGMALLGVIAFPVALIVFGAVDRPTLNLVATQVGVALRGERESGVDDAEH